MSVRIIPRLDVELMPRKQSVFQPEITPNGVDPFRESNEDVGDSIRIWCGPDIEIGFYRMTLSDRSLTLLPVLLTHSHSRRPSQTKWRTLPLTVLEILGTSRLHGVTLHLPPTVGALPVAQLLLTRLV